MVHLVRRADLELVRSLALRSARLRQVALEPASIVDLLRMMVDQLEYGGSARLHAHCMEVATMLLRMGGTCDVADVPEEVWAVGRLTPRRVALLDELEKRMPSLSGRVTELKAKAALAARDESIAEPENGEEEEAEEEADGEEESEGGEESPMEDEEWEEDGDGHFSEGPDDDMTDT